MPTADTINYRPSLMTVDGRNSLFGRWLRRLPLLAALALPAIASAVVCPFVTNMPTGKQPVGHATQWVDGATPAESGLIQWWYPADPVKDSASASHVYTDYVSELLQSRAMPEGGFDPEVHQRVQLLNKAAKERGSPRIRFDHMMAAGMLAARESTRRAGNWPVIWLEGDPSFADQLASHGFIVVSSPAAYDATPSHQQRLQTAIRALEATREKFQNNLRQLAFVGIRDGVPLAAALSGRYPQSKGLALIGDWPALNVRGSRNETGWLDAAEIYAPTLQITAGAKPPAALSAHPLNAPFSATERLYITDVDDVHLEYGLPEACAPKYVEGRPVKPLVLIVSQYETRSRLAKFLTGVFAVPFEPAPMALMPMDQRRLEPLQMTEARLAARIPAPPEPGRIAELLQSGGVQALLKAVPTEALPLLAGSWWEAALAQIQFSGDPQQSASLVDAWLKHQPGSLAAAVHHAGLAQDRGEDAHKLWKQARKRVKSDPRVSPERRAELAAAIEAALKKP